MKNNSINENNIKPAPLLMSLMEKVNGCVSHDSQLGDDPTYSGATGPTGDQADYDSD